MTWDWGYVLMLALGIYTGTLASVLTRAAVGFARRKLERRAHERHRAQEEAKSRQAVVIREFALPQILERHPDAPTGTDDWQVCTVTEFRDRAKLCVPAPLPILPHMHTDEVSLYVLATDTPWGEIRYGYHTEADVGEIHVLATAIEVEA